MVASVVQFLIDFFELNGVVKPPENAAEVPLLSVGGHRKRCRNKLLHSQHSKILIIIFCHCAREAKGKEV
jgi:hypothetical protein